MTAGEEFVKWLKPGGCILLIVVFILVLMMCFGSGKNPLPGYESLHDTAYYSQSDERLKELGQELEQNVFPRLDGEETWNVEDDRLVITLENEYFIATRSAILRYYDDSLFEFRKDGAL